MGVAFTECFWTRFQTEPGHLREIVCLVTIALARIFVYGFADNQGTRMHRTNLTHQNPVDGAATTMFGLPCAEDGARQRRPGRQVRPRRGPHLALHEPNATRSEGDRKVAFVVSRLTTQDQRGDAQLEKDTYDSRPRLREKGSSVPDAEKDATALAGRLLPAVFDLEQERPAPKLLHVGRPNPQPRSCDRRSRVEEQASGIDKIVRGRSRGREQRSETRYGEGGRRVRRCVDLRERRWTEGGDCRASFRSCAASGRDLNRRTAL